MLFKPNQISLYPVIWFGLLVPLVFGEVQDVKFQDLKKECQDYCIANKNHPYPGPCNSAWPCVGLCFTCKQICRNDKTLNQIFIICPQIDEVDDLGSTTTIPSLKTTKSSEQQIHVHEKDETPPPSDSPHANKGRPPEDKEDADADEGSGSFAVLARLLILFNLFATFVCCFMCLRFFRKPKPVEVAPTTSGATTVVIEGSQSQLNPSEPEPTPIPEAPRPVPQPRQYPSYPPPYYPYQPPPYAPYYVPPPYGYVYYMPPEATPQAPAPQSPAIQDKSTSKRNSVQSRPPKMPEAFSPKRDSVSPPMPTQSVTQLLQYDNRDAAGTGKARQNSGSSGKKNK